MPNDLYDTISTSVVSDSEHGLQQSGLRGGYVSPAVRAGDNCHRGTVGSRNCKVPGYQSRALGSVWVFTKAIRRQRFEEVVRVEFATDPY